jgi:hypothetical protein
MPSMVDAREGVLDVLQEDPSLAVFLGQQHAAYLHLRLVRA